MKGTPLHDEKRTHVEELKGEEDQVQKPKRRK